MADFKFVSRNDQEIGANLTRWVKEFEEWVNSRGHPYHGIDVTCPLCISNWRAMRALVAVEDMFTEKDEDNE